MKRLIPMITIFCGFFFPSPLIAQTQLQVVEKTVTRQVTLSDAETFALSLEKADVKIIGWDRQYVQIKLVFSAKHTDRAVAREELEYIKYSLIREGGEVKLANTFLIPAHVHRLKSSLNFACEIMMPLENRIRVSVKYGNIEIMGLKGNSTIHSEFGEVYLSSVEGSVTMKSSFSNIRGDHITGTLTCTADKSEIDLSAIEGNFTFNTNLGKIDLNFGDQLKSLSIKSNRTSVTIRPGNFQRYNYELSAIHSNLFLNEVYQHMITKNGNSSSFSFLSNTNNPQVKIQTTYSAITIKF